MSRLALAYLLRRPVQLFAVVGVAVGLLALLVVLSVMNGLIEKGRESARGPLSDLLLLPAVTEEPARYEAYRAALAEVAEVRATAPHLVTYAVLGVPGASGVLATTRLPDLNGVQVVGIDPAAEMQVTGFGASLERAEVAPVRDPADPFDQGLGEEDRWGARPGVLLSDTLARSPAFFLGRGDRIQLGTLPPVLPGPEERLQVHFGTFTLAGTYKSADYRMDLDRIYMRRSGFDGLSYNLLYGKEPTGPDFTEILIRLRQDPPVSYENGKVAVLRALAAAGLPEPGGRQGGALQTWEERRKVYLTAIENERRVTALVLFFIVIVAGFGLFATLSALVREKVRDLGVLAALGCTPLRRGALLLTVGALGSLAGTAAGLAAAWWLVRNSAAVERFLHEQLGIVIFRPDLYVIEGLPTRWITEQALLLSAGAFLVGCLFTLLPAARAASLSPTEALRYE